MNKLNNLNIIDECMDESTFYPPQDDRLYCSGVYDICGGDNFNDFSVWFWETYEDEIFDN